MCLWNDLAVCDLCMPSQYLLGADSFFSNLSMLHMRKGLTPASTFLLSGFVLICLLQCMNLVHF